MMPINTLPLLNYFSLLTKAFTYDKIFMKRVREKLGVDKFMKKLLMSFIVVSLIGTSLTKFQAKIPSDIIPYVSITDSESGSKSNFEIIEEEIQTKYLTNNRTRSTEGKYETEYNTVIKINNLAIEEGIMPMSDVSTNHDEAYVRANLKITYTLSGENIRVEKVSGSWTALNGMPITFSNREVMVTNGGLLYIDDKTNKYYPTSNSFSYSTGWGYISKYPAITETGTGARAYSEVDASVSGMGNNKHTVFVMLYVP